MRTWGFLLFYTSLCPLFYSQKLNFELLHWSAPWSSRLNLKFQELSDHTSDPIVSDLYRYLNSTTTVVHPLTSLWIVYGGWTSTGVLTIPTGDYKTFTYSQPRTFPDLWISTNQGYTWLNVATQAPRYYLHIYCGVITPTGAGFNVFQRGWLPAWDPDLASQDPHRISYAAWELFVTQPFDTNDKKYCLGPDVRIRYTLGLDITITSSRTPWYQIDPDRFLRVGLLSSTHYNNSHLGGRDIRYILAGSLIQPDYGQYNLRDLWASSDSGQSWVPVVYNPIWDVETWQTSLVISRLGVIVVNVNRGQRGLGSDLFASLDGGRTWGVCTYNASYGRHNGGLLFFDREGYLNIMGGYTGWEVDDVWRSDMSFHDLEDVTEKCQIALPSEGIGLTSWLKSQDLNLKLQPAFGIISLDDMKESGSWIWLTVVIGIVILIGLIGYTATSDTT